MTMGVSRENKEPQNIQNETKPEHHITQENTKPDKDERTITFDEAQQLMDTPQVQLSPEAEISPDTIQSDTPVKEDIAPDITPDTLQIVMPSTNETAVKTQDNHQKNTAQKIMGLRGVGNKKSNIKSSDNNTQHNEITDAIKTKISQKIFE